jgi:Ni,Fe-hydrogenase I cytochrome b subunit
MFVARGADAVTAEQQAWAQLYAIVRREAMALSFIDNFWRLAWIFVAVIPFVLFLGRRAQRAQAPADVERAATLVES